MRQSQYTANRQQIGIDSELAELRLLFGRIEDKRVKNAKNCNNTQIDYWKRY